MQNSGTLAELPLAGILETIQKDRATGTLQITGAPSEATLYFLFGHLFHAVEGDRMGEPVVYDALGWTVGDFTFDSKAKLPAEESIKVSTAELLAQRASGAGPAEPPEQTKTGPAAGSDGLPEHEFDAGSIEATLDTAEEIPAPDVLDAPLPVDEPTVPVVAQKRRRTDTRPGTRPPETMDLYPVPLGQLVYEALTAAFVDFPKLLRSLAKDEHSGYVRLTGTDFHAVLLFSNGAVVEAIYDGGGEVSTGAEAFRRFGQNIDDSEGSLDVIELTEEMVTAIYQLLTAPGLHDRLLARFVKVEALLEHLTEEGLSGAVIVRHEKKVGIVLYRAGAILGCYTESSRDVDVDPAKVLAICKDPKAQIEVRGGPLPDALPVLEPDGTVGQKMVPARSSAPATRLGPATVSAPVIAEPEPEPAEAVAPEPEVTEEPAPEPAAPEPAVVEAAAPEYAESPNGTDTDGADWGAVVSQMAGRADAVLGTRAKKVKELLFAAGQNREDVENTIERISELSIMFVDPSKLADLATEMRQIAASAG